MTRAAAQKLIDFIERLEKLLADRKTLGTDIRQVNAEVKAAGFDVPTVTKLIRLRAMDSETRENQAELLKLYADLVGIDAIEASGLMSSKTETDPDSPRPSRRRRPHAEAVT